jgi:hypothetical protein
MDFWCFEGKTLRRSGSHDPAMAWAATQEREALPSWGITTTWLRSLEKSWLQQPFFYVRCRYEMMGHCGTFCGVIWYIIVSIMYIYILYHIISYYIILYYSIYIYTAMGALLFWDTPSKGWTHVELPPSTISCLGKLCLAFSTLTVSYWNHGPSK